MRQIESWQRSLLVSGRASSRLRPCGSVQLVLSVHAQPACPKTHCGLLGPSQKFDVLLHANGVWHVEPRLHVHPGLPRGHSGTGLQLATLVIEQGLSMPHVYS
jgi:hypothetical protein